MIPSSEIYPNDLNAGFKSDFESVGNNVPSGALAIAPLAFGFAAVTFDADAVVGFIRTNDIWIVVF